MNKASITEQIRESFTKTEEVVVNDFLAFEPFDVVQRDARVFDQMKEDKVDLYEPGIIDVIGKDPHPFQTGYILSINPHRILLAGTQVGKSRTALQDAITMLTGIVPYSMRVPQYTDTGIPRPINMENILRFGRWTKISKELIDHNPRARKDGTWDCGNIMGVGVYPSDKLCPDGKQVWIGTTAQALLKYWWPKMIPGTKCVIPFEFLNNKKGNNGYDRTHNLVHFLGDKELIFTTYESQYDKFEAERAHAVILDEEPPNEKILAAAGTHAKFLSIVMTPYRGITYAEDFVFNKDKNRRPEVFHATAYDSPYRHADDIANDRKLMKPYEIKARIYGLFSEITGEPYYDRIKLMNWHDQMKEDENSVKYAKLIPQSEYNEINEIVNIDVKPEEVNVVDELDTWRIFEHPRPDIGYVAGVDIAEGSENPAEASDRQAICILRLPLRNSREKEPVVCATLRSTLPVHTFANIVAHGCAYYNNAVLAPESMRGYHNGAFMVEVNEYPYFFTMMTTNDKTRKPTSRRGFVTNPKNREAIFNFFDKKINETDETERCPFKDIDLVKELVMAIVGKNGKCDHTRKGTLDTAVAHGIALYVAKISPEQIICYKKKKDEFKDVPFGRIKWLIDGKPDMTNNRQNFTKGHIGAFI